MRIRLRQLGSRSAFTIAELLIVLMVLTIVACLAITTYFSQPNITLQNACELLVDDMISAKNRAAILRDDVSFTFYEAGNGYEARDASDELLPSPAGRGDFIRDYGFDGVFEGVRVVEVQLGDDRTVVFNRKGHATESGSVTLEFGGERRVVDVSATLGVSIREETSTAHQ